MKVSASIYSNKEKPLPELVAELDRYHVDFFHIDCNDDLSVFEDIETIQRISSTPIDLHIISSEPEKYFEGINKTKPAQVTFQFENLPANIIFPKFEITRAGLAFVSSTHFDKFVPFQNFFSHILFMATTPGKSGGEFNLENFARIRKFRKKFPATQIQVDGGINDDISFVLRNLGVSLIVSGSYLVNADFVGRALHRLRNDNSGSRICIRDFMIPLNELPVLSANDFSLEKVLTSIDQSALGFTMVKDKSGKLDGIITNADLRRGLIREIHHLDSIDPYGLVNHNPATIHSLATVSEMIQYIQSLKFPVLFLPVVDKDGKLEGAVTFNNLIKGES